MTICTFAKRDSLIFRIHVGKWALNFLPPKPSAPGKGENLTRPLCYGWFVQTNTCI